MSTRAMKKKMIQRFRLLEGLYSYKRLLLLSFLSVKDQPRLYLEGNLGFLNKRSKKKEEGQEKQLSET